MALSSVLVPCVLVSLALTQYLLLAAPSCETVLPPKCEKVTTGSLHPHESRCDWFYRCDELNVARILACPDGQHFLGLSDELCVPASRVPCQRCPEVYSDRNEVCGPPKCPPTPTCEVSEKGDLKPYPPDCNKFIYCDEVGNERISNCANGTHFSVTAEKCVDPVIANCVYCLP